MYPVNPHAKGNVCAVIFDFSEVIGFGSVDVIVDLVRH